MSTIPNGWMNAPATYTSLGQRSGLAARRKDYTTSRDIYQYACRCFNLESGEVRQQARELFDAAYKEETAVC